MSKPVEEWLTDREKKIIDAILHAVGAQMKELRARVEALEAGGYKGVYDPKAAAAGVYMKYATVTRGGSLWIAERDHPPGVPGDSGSGWKLAVKRGHAE